MTCGNSCRTRRISFWYGTKKNALINPDEGVTRFLGLLSATAVYPYGEIPTATGINYFRLRRKRPSEMKAKPAISMLLGSGTS